METNSTFFLPSEIARLVLGYLEDEGYTNTCKSFMKECIHLQEYVTLLKKGRQYPLTINGFSLIQMLEKFAQFYLVDVNKQNVSVSALWNQLESLMGCLKRQTGYKNLRIEGASQNSRTRRGNIRSKLEINEKGDGSRSSGYIRHVEKSRLSVDSEKSRVLQSKELSERLAVAPKESKSECRTSNSANMVKEKTSPPVCKQKLTGKKPMQILIIKSPSKAVGTCNQTSESLTQSSLSKDKSNSVVNMSSQSLEKSKMAFYSKTQVHEIVSTETIMSNLTSNLKKPVSKANCDTDESDNEPSDSGTGFHDSAIDCNTQLSPLPTVFRNDDVKDISAEGVKLSVCDKKNEDIPVCDKLNGQKLETMNNQPEHDINGNCDISSHSVNGMEIDEDGEPNKSKDKDSNDENVTGASEIQQSGSADMHLQLHEGSECITKETSTVQDKDKTPKTPKKDIPTNDAALSKTPCKNLRYYGFQGQGKSPRRKRRPKRKPHGDKIADRRTSLTHLNESSNSNDGSVHDNSFPTQFLEQLMNNPLLHEKLAENINKTINCTDFGKSHNSSETSGVQDTNQEVKALTPKPSTSLEDILDPHESQMTGEQINDIIEMTKGEVAFDSLFKLFNEDAGKANCPLEADEKNPQSHNISVSHNIPVTSSNTSNCETLSQTPSEVFKPISNTEILNNDCVLSFPIKDIYEESLKNMYVSEDSINAVLNPFLPSNARTLNTPTDFSKIDFMNVNTSTSSSITPTVTITSSSNYVMSAVSSITVTSQSLSNLCLQETYSQHFSQASFPQKSPGPSESSNCKSATQTETLEAVHNLLKENGHRLSDSNAPVSTDVPTSSGSKQETKNGSYVSFVKGVTSSQNSSTPVGQRASPLTVRFDDNSKTFHELPSEVQNLYSSFEENLSDLSKNKEEENAKTASVQTRSSRKNKKVSPKSNQSKTKTSRHSPVSGQKGKSNRKLSSKKSSHISNDSDTKSYKENSDAGVKISSKLKIQVSDKQEYVSISKQQLASKKGNSTPTSTDISANLSQVSDESRSTLSIKSATVNSKKSPTENKTVKKKDKKSPTCSKIKDKRSTPKPQIRCNPLQPRSENKCGKSNSTPKSTSSKWSSGLSALIKIASPEKLKTDLPGNENVSTKLKENEKSDVPMTHMLKNNEHTPKRIPAALPCLQTPSPKDKSLKDCQKKSQTSTCSISPDAKNCHEPINNTTRNESIPESLKIVKLDPSCLGMVVKVSTHYGMNNDADNVTKPCYVKSSSSATITQNSTTEHKQEGGPLLSMPLLDTDSIDGLGVQLPEHCQSEITQSPSGNSASVNSKASTDYSSESELQSMKSHQNLQPQAQKINLNEIIYTESRDFLESPDKSRVGRICSIGNQIHESHVIYTATPLTDITASDQIHIRTLDFDVKSNSSLSPVEKNSVQRTKRHCRRSLKQTPRNSGKVENGPAIIKKRVLDVINADTLKSTVDNSSSKNINVCYNSSTSNQYVNLPLVSSESIGLKSVVDSACDKSVSFSRNESVSEPGNEYVSSDYPVVIKDGRAQKSMALPATSIPLRTQSGVQDDFIPDAVGNVHMNNGQVMNVRPTASQIGIQELSNDSTPLHSPNSIIIQTPNEIPMNIPKFVPVDRQNVVPVALNMVPLQTPNKNNILSNQNNVIVDPAGQRFIVSPSCQKLIGHLGLHPHTDKHLGQPIDTHLKSSKSTVDENLTVPALYDIHLTRENSNDTCSSEVERISDSAQKNPQNRNISSKKENLNNEKSNLHVINSHSLKTFTESPFSTDSEEIDVEGEWENPWKNVSCDNDVTLTESLQNVTIQEGDSDTMRNSFQKENAGHVENSTTSNKSGQAEQVSTNQDKEIIDKFLKSPPKKRVTASLKCGSGLYFVSTHGEGNDKKNNKSDINVKTKKTPKKSQDHFTNLRRSPRTKTDTKTVNKPDQLMEKVKRNLNGNNGEVDCDKIKPGSKRSREESEDDKVNTESKSKTRKCKTPVDLSKVNVNKFLDKLYKL